MRTWTMPSISRQQFLSFLLLLAFGVGVVLSAKAHRLAGAWFPPPWPDEASYAWMAISFAEQGTLLAPELNPDRVFHWMPPGYPVLTGLVYRIFGYSFSLMRWISWACVVAYFAFILLWARRERCPWESLLIVPAFMLNGFFVAAGNLGRMESMLMAWCAGCFVLLQTRFRWGGLFLLAVGPLIHPNGIIFFAAGALSAAIAGWGEWKKPRKPDWFMFLAAVLPWLAYLLFIVGDWDNMVNDLLYQLRTHHGMFIGQFDTPTASGSWLAFLKSLLGLSYLWLLLAYLLLGIYLLLKKKRLLVFGAFGGACLLIRVIGAEMWYVAMGVSSVLVLILCGFRIAQETLERWRWPNAGVVGCRVVLFAAILAGCVKLNLVPLQRAYPSGLRWWQLELREHEPYLNAEDREAVLVALRGRSPQANTRVAFLPVADSLFFYPWSRNMFVAHAPAGTTLEADVDVIHYSSREAWDAYRGVGIKSPERFDDGAAYVVRTRGEHQWSIVAGKAKLPRDSSAKSE